MTIRTYSELMKLETLTERFRYLSLGGAVADRTFGSERWLNQRFYTSREWRDVRHHVIARDEGCDLGVLDYPIFNRPVIHHMNPMVSTDLKDFDEKVLDPEYLITTVHATHNEIHYGTEEHLPRPLVDRFPGDTLLWRRKV